jgi:metal-sulfur cluster biosynthetic enzyme
MVSNEEVEKVFKEYLDPEIMIDVWTLGLIYDIKIDGASVDVTMTFTSPTCPFGPQMVEDLESEIKKVDGVEKVQINITFEPAWKPSEEVKEMLGLL